MAERPGLLERLRQLFSSSGDGKARVSPPRPPHGNGPPPGCEDIEEIPCEEAARRVYEYLDGELESAKAEEIRCHVQQCERCYPMYNWERLFLDALRDRGGRPESVPELKERVKRLLDSQGG